MAPLSQLVSSYADPSVDSLTELAATMGPYHPDVRLWVAAASVESSSVQLRVRVDGKEVETAPVELVHDPRILTDETVGGWIDIGELNESAAVEFEVDNAAGLSNVQSRIVIDGCLVTEANGSCAERGCVARSAAIVAPPSCSLN
jgi:hypothetical protein